MNIVMIVLLVLNMVLTGLCLYNTYGVDRRNMASEIDTVSEAVDRVSECTSRIETRVLNLITVSNKNNKAIQNEFSSVNEDMRNITDRLQAAEDGIREVDRNEHEIRTYYLNYVSRNKVGFENGVADV